MENRARVRTPGKELNREPNDTQQENALSRTQPAKEVMQYIREKVESTIQSFSNNERRTYEKA
jgi:hypothetical protein